MKTELDTDVTDILRALNDPDSVIFNSFNDQCLYFLLSSRQHGVVGDANDT